MTTDKFGFTDWSDDTGPKGGRAQNTNTDNAERIQFARLEEGNNIFRIITKPARFQMVRFKAAPDEKGFGRRLNVSVPTASDPAVKAGFKPKSRWLAGAIDRRDNQVKILDLGVTTYEQLKSLNEDIEWGDPGSYDINIRRNSKAGAAGYYTVLPRGKAPLSPSDCKLKEQHQENLEQTLVRLITPPKPEMVLKRMEQMGYKGGVVAVASKPNGSPLPETTDDDYSFEQPTAQA